MIDLDKPYCVYKSKFNDGHYYIGRSQTHKVMNDGYKGSGAKLNLVMHVNAEYHYHSCDTEIIATFDTEIEAINHEKALVNTKMLSDPYNLNLCEGGNFGRTMTTICKDSGYNTQGYPSMRVDLIKTFVTKIGDEDVIATDARELHTALAVGKTFGAWITERIEKYEFIEGEDYVKVVSSSGIKPQPFTENGKNLGGRPTVDYHLTLDMAKELSMVQNNAAGKNARKYFIQVEKEYYNAAFEHVHQTTISNEVPSNNVERASNIIKDTATIGELFGLTAAEACKPKIGYIKRETGVDIRSMINTALKKQSI